MKPFYWLVKREFWEHRGGFLWAPIITGGLFLLLNLMGIITAQALGAGGHLSFGANGGLQMITKQMDAGNMEQVGLALDVAMYSATGLLMVVLGFVVFFYFLGALYDDRRDRSILFWKSMPISDLSTVLSKVVAGTIVAPVIAVLVGIIVGMLQLLMVAIVLSFHGVHVWELLTLGHPFKVVANLLGYLPLYVLWAAPAVGWLMLCSAWARSKPFLWAVALPVSIGALVSWFGVMGMLKLPGGWFWSHIVQRALLSVFPGSGSVFSADENPAAGLPGAAASDMLNLSTTWHLAASPNLWIGVIFGVALLAGATWLRRWRDDS